MGMGINWKPEEAKFALMESKFLMFGKKAISMNHYDLAEKTKSFACQLCQFEEKDWREFLTDKRVIAYINAEFDAIKGAELRKIISNISDSRSVGQAQIINSLCKMLENKDDKHDGPAYVYTYIPPNPEQAQAPNAKILETDPFEVEVDDEST